MLIFATLKALRLLALLMNHRSSLSVPVALEHRCAIIRAFKLLVPKKS